MRIACLVLLSSTVAAADNVLVPESVELHPTKDAALADSKQARSGKPIAMRLVRTHGDVVELQTGEVLDCADSRDVPYKLSVFVRRDHLFGRIKTPVKQTFPDGTALVLDRGAPVLGLDWAKRPLDPRNIAIATPGALGKAELPRAGTMLVCDGGSPMTLDEAMAKQRARAKPAKPAPSKQDDANRLADMMASDSLAMSPPCSVRDNALPTIDGKTVVWPAPNVFPASVAKVGDAFLADVHVWCGRARMRIDKAEIGDSGGGGGALGMGGGKRTVWSPRRGKVTWPDGKPAGTYAGGASYTDVVERDTRICVHVDGVAELVCHDKRLVTRDDD